MGRGYSSTSTRSVSLHLNCLAARILGDAKSSNRKNTEEELSPGKPDGFQPHPPLQPELEPGFPMPGRNSPGTSGCWALRNVSSLHLHCLEPWTRRSLPQLRVCLQRPSVWTLPDGLAILLKHKPRIAFFILKITAVNRTKRRVLSCSSPPPKNFI